MIFSLVACSFVIRALCAFRIYPGCWVNISIAFNYLTISCTVYLPLTTCLLPNPHCLWFYIITNYPHTLSYMYFIKLCENLLQWNWSKKLLTLTRYCTIRFSYVMAVASTFPPTEHWGFLIFTSPPPTLGLIQFSSWLGYCMENVTSLVDNLHFSAYPWIWASVFLLVNCLFRTFIQFSCGVAVFFLLAFRDSLWIR